VTSAEALGAAAAVGPYFTWEPWAPDAGWRPLTDLTDGDVLAERVAAARAALIGMFGLAEDDVPERVIASVTFLGVASRLVSPPLGAVILGGALPVPSADQLWWRPVPGGPWPIAYSSDPEPASGSPVSGADDFGAVSGGLVSGSDAAGPGSQAAMPSIRLMAVDRSERSSGGSGSNSGGSASGSVGSGPGEFVGGIVEGLVAPVLRAFQARFVLSPQVLWGNVASALAGAAGMLGSEAAGDLVERVLALPPLAGTGTLVRPDPAGPRRFLVRHNCCLYYRIPGGGTCGDCVLTPADDRRRQWASVLGR
jgi:hypothetical protein